MSNKNYYYVTGNTAEGFVNCIDSNIKGLAYVIVLKHPSYLLKTKLITAVKRKFCENYTLEVVYSAFSKDYLDGIIIREKSIAILSDNLNTQGLEGIIEINLDNFTKKADINSNQYSLIRKLTDAAYGNFSQGLKIHDDELETIYVNQMNFDKADKLSEKLITKLLQDVPKQNRTPHIYHRLFGTNTIEGVVNIVPHIIDGISNRFFLKGRAGTGKSVFMKKVVKACEERGFDIELYHCSFDPNSIDMVLVRDLDFCIFDSTDPHEIIPDRDEDVVIDMYEETVTPGTDEKYASEIARINSHYKSYMKKGIEHLKEAGALQTELERNYMEGIKEEEVGEMLNFIIEIVT